MKKKISLVFLSLMCAVSAYAKEEPIKSISKDVSVVSDGSTRNLYVKFLNGFYGITLPEGFYPSDEAQIPTDKVVVSYPKGQNMKDFKEAVVYKVSLKNFHGENFITKERLELWLKKEALVNCVNKDGTNAGSALYPIYIPERKNAGFAKGLLLCSYKDDNNVEMVKGEDIWFSESDETYSVTTVIVKVPKSEAKTRQDIDKLWDKANKVSKVIPPFIACPNTNSLDSCVKEMKKASK